MKTPHYFKQLILLCSFTMYAQFKVTDYSWKFIEWKHIKSIQKHWNIIQFNLFFALNELAAFLLPKWKFASPSIHWELSLENVKI